MSTMLVTLVKNLVLLAGVSGVAMSSDFNAALQAPSAQPAPPQSVAGDQALSAAIAQWKQLQQSDGYAFQEYATFLIAHPGWPGERSRRIAAEGALARGGYSPSLAINFFERFPPITATGKVRYAEALRALGKTEKANEQARAAWRAGVLRTEDEALILGSFPGALQPADHDARMDALLWQGATSAATRLLAYTSPAAQPVFAARIAFRTRAPDIAARDAAVTGAARQDAGFIADRATWLRNTAQGPVARAYLAQPRQLSARPGDVEQWYEVLLANARGAENDSQFQTAYNIASKVDDAFPIATDVSTKDLGVRDDYTSLVWLAGTTAMQDLNRPADAVGMFERYARGSRTPQTQSKGLYWAGRAAEAAGDRQNANAFYTEAAGFSDLFYGQLAKERMGQALTKPGDDKPPVDDATRRAFFARETVRAAQWLGRTGATQDQTAFVRQIAADVKTDAEHALAFELADSLDRPDLGVMVGRSARLNGFTDYTADGYPAISVPGTQASNWTMIHAIARQESQFDRSAISHAGARGLMQLMPATAREAAGKLGLAYSADSLTADPSYNIQLGSSYFQRMLDYYGGSYPLAVAAYNAGPGNVNKWIAANGDPRLPSIDVVEWIEEIPYYETKNYVHRVLENAVVYDLLTPSHARSRGPANLSWYLDKNKPG